MQLDFDMGYSVDDLECPWCGNKGIVDYGDFGDSNGSQQQTECYKCEKPLETTIDYQFTIRKI